MKIDRKRVEADLEAAANRLRKTTYAQDPQKYEELYAAWKKLYDLDAAMKAVERAMERFRGEAHKNPEYYV